MKLRHNRAPHRLHPPFKLSHFNSHRSRDLRGLHSPPPLTERSSRNPSTARVEIQFTCFLDFQISKLPEWAPAHVFDCFTFENLRFRMIVVDSNITY